MATTSPTLSVFDTKSYDRDYLGKRATEAGLAIKFHDYRLEVETVGAAKHCRAVSVFVNDPITREVLEGLAGEGVRHLALRCAGHNNVDIEAAKSLGIQVTRVPSYSPHAVAEHTLALLLSLNRKIHRAYNRVREMNFSIGGLVGFDLFGKTVGVIGTGKIGRLAAEIFRGFKMNVLAYDPFPDPAWASANGIAYTSIENLMASSDIISLHTPLTPQTDQIINAQSLAAMKPGVVIVNVSRGRLIDTYALIEALKTGQVGGVALDVYEEEEGVFFEDLSGEVLQDDELARLLSFPNVLVTSHQAFLTEEALNEIARVTVENVLRLAAGNPAIEGTTL